MIVSIYFKNVHLEKCHKRDKRRTDAAANISLLDNAWYSLHVMRWYFLHYDTTFLIFCCEQNTEDNASEISVLWTSRRWFVEFEIYSIIGKFHLLLCILPMMQHRCFGFYKYTLWHNVPFSVVVSRIRKITRLSCACYGLREDDSFNSS